MNVLLSRKLRYYYRLQYPVRATLGECGFVGRLPDLPGCECQADSCDELYAQLEIMRRDWIRDRLERGEAVPLPNSHVPTRVHATRRQTGEFAPAP